MIKITLNQKVIKLDVDPQMPLLYALRDELKLTGTKYGCGAGQCGACTVQVNGKAMRSCVLPMSAIAEQEITTIEGLTNKAGKVGESEVQIAWREFKVPQCGYCQSGQMMSADALLKTIPQPSDEQIIEHMQGNICRCGTYKRIKAAIKSVAEKSSSNMVDVQLQDTSSLTKKKQGA